MRVLILMACTLAGISACGQRGALYVPDKNARVVTHPPAASAPGSAPSSAPR